MQLVTVRSIDIKAVAVSVIVIFAGLGVFGAKMAFASSATPAYDNIQIFVNPQNSSLNQFSLEAYNSTGGLVASSQSSYPAFSLELPGGNYLFAVSASSSYAYPVPGPLSYGSTASQKSAIAYPNYYNPAEYGYLVTELNSSRTVNISTHQIDNMSTTKVTVVAKYSNGTAAAGTSVYASIVGGYYWYDTSNNLVLSNQTGNDGVATLIVPSVPLEITAWNWLPVNLPQSQTTTQVTIGGEPVNVTVYWQPTYIGLAGSALLIPPSQQAEITLKAQPQNFWAFPQGVASSQTVAPVPGSASSAPSAVANGPGAVPASVEQNSQQRGAQSQVSTQTVPSQIPPLPASTVTFSTTTTANVQSSTSSLLVEGGIAAAIVISIAAAVLALRRK